MCFEFHGAKLNASHLTVESRYTHFPKCQTYFSNKGITSLSVFNFVFFCLSFFPVRKTPGAVNVFVPSHKMEEETTAAHWTFVTNSFSIDREKFCSFC